MLYAVIKTNIVNLSEKKPCSVTSLKSATSAISLHGGEGRLIAEVIDLQVVAQHSALLV